MSKDTVTINGITFTVDPTNRLSATAKALLESRGVGYSFSFSGYSVEELYIDDPIAPVVCECGADKCRHPTHSSWCPKFEK